MTRAQRYAVLAAIARREWLLQMLALSVAGCRRGGEPARDPRSTLAVRLAELLEDTPQMFADGSTQFLMFLPLLTRNARGELEGQLAWRWEHSSDYREWTYHLRPGIRWHDGVPVTADDVKFSLELLAHPDLPFSSLGRAVESITVVDRSTIRIRDPHADRYQFWTIYYPKHLLKDFDPKKFASWDFWRHPVGNGPFRFLHYVPRTMMELEANPAYYKGKPRIERIVFKFAGAGGLTDLLSGDVDLIPSPALGISRALRDPRFRTYHYDEGPSPTASPAWAIFWNNQHALFRDASVRRALTLAINRRELLQVLTLPEELPLIDAPFTFRQRLRGQLPPPLPYDPGQSRALLEGAGWHDRNGDGVRERDGKAFRFSALVSGPAAWEATALYVQDSLRRVGVDMQIRNMEFGSNVASFTAGQFEARFGNIWLGPQRVEEFFGTASPFGYHNDAVVDVIHRVTATADPDVEDRLYRELADLIRADAPMTFLFPRLQMSVGNRRLQGLSVHSRTRSGPWTHCGSKSDDAGATTRRPRRDRAARVALHTLMLAGDGDLRVAPTA